MSSQLKTILQRLEMGELAALFAAHEIDDSLLADLTDTDLQKIGIDKLGPRKKLLAAFAELAGLSEPPAREKIDPAFATRDRPFVSSLGLPFVPITGYAALFCIWPLRVQDYQLYCESASAPFPACDFAQGPDHPVVNVSWHDAMAFCHWLTKRDREQGLITSSLSYRLPEDLEWSAAVGLVQETGRTPEERSGKIKRYPWGGEFPPPREAGNYHPKLGTDTYRETSPVGSFPANALGIHDLGGNVWEWCKDTYNRESDQRVLRGASCFNDDDEYLLSSYRDKKSPGDRSNNCGIRLVLAATHERDPWF